MNCPKCETKIEDSDDYCRKCGEPISDGGKQKLTLFDTLLGLMLLSFLLLFAWLAIDTYFRIVDNETWRKLFFMAAAGGIG
ncbi:MAG: zinc-ribbon domain-containing protein, partial [Euryarchaeota archaeon]|nr:zinc-ribbon domain-containing protein [Euryarchaeota archaeon]